MKKILFLFGSLLSLAGTAQAQTARVGIKVGLGLSTVTGSNTERFNSILGFNGGLMADVPFHELFSFHPELLYSQRGVSYVVKDPRGTAATADVDTRFNYLDLPLLLRLKAKGLFAEFGPQAGILLASNTDVTVKYPGQQPYTSSESSTDGVRKVDVGYVLGLGYQLPLGLEFGARYNGGLLDVSDPSDSSKNYHSVFQFQVGYLFKGR